jgi:hypothetical protein
MMVLVVPSDGLAAAVLAMPTTSRKLVAQMASSRRIDNPSWSRKYDRNVPTAGAPRAG